MLLCQGAHRKGVQGRLGHADVFGGAAGDGLTIGLVRGDGRSTQLVEQSVMQAGWSWPAPG
jgi:hypothetical protein